MQFRYWMTLLFLSLLLASFGAFAGKVDQVKTAFKENCKADLGESEVMDAVLKAFDCVPGSDVKIGTCSIKCLKEGGGNVVGK